MQFKSIVAVLALAVAVIATPVEPAAVKLVERTTPTNTPTTTTTTTTQALCNQSNQVATSCKYKGVQQSADQVVNLLASLLPVLNDLLSSLLSNAKILDNLTCVVQGNNIPIASGQKALCCTNPGGNSNNQSGNLIALNVQSSCSAVQAV